MRTSSRCSDLYVSTARANSKSSHWLLTAKLLYLYLAASNTFYFPSLSLKNSDFCRIEKVAALLCRETSYSSNLLKVLLNSTYSADPLNFVIDHAFQSKVLEFDFSKDREIIAELEQSRKFSKTIILGATTESREVKTTKIPDNIKCEETDADLAVALEASLKEY